MPSLWALIILWNGAFAVDMGSKDACVAALAQVKPAAYCVSRSTGEVVRK